MVSGNNLDGTPNVHVVVRFTDRIAIESAESVIIIHSPAGVIPSLGSKGNDHYRRC